MPLDRLLDHCVEQLFDFRLEAGLNLIHVREFDKRSGAARAEPIHPGNPVSIHRQLLFLGILDAGSH